MCTRSLICVSSDKVVAQQTSSGIRDTHSTMNKRFYFHIVRNICADFTDFFQRKFSCSYYSFCSKTIPESVSFIIGIISLCTDMTLYFRTDFPRIGKNTRVCDDQRIRLQFFQFLKIFSYSWKVIIMCQNINCNIDFYSMFMGKSNSLCHIFVLKILGFCPKPESLSTNIYCICPKHHCNLQYFKTAGWHK